MWILIQKRVSVAQCCEKGMCLAINCRGADKLDLYGQFGIHINVYKIFNNSSKI